MKLKIVLKRSSDGYFVVSVPALRGCWSQGRTRTQALHNIREAIQLYLAPDPQEVRPGKGRDVVDITL